MKKYHISIEGMGCDHCVRSVEDALAEVGAYVNTCAIGSADVTFNGSTDTLLNAVKDAGFEVTGISEV